MWQLLVHSPCWIVLHPVFILQFMHSAWWKFAFFPVQLLIRTYCYEILICGHILGPYPYVFLLHHHGHIQIYSRHYQTLPKWLSPVICLHIECESYRCSDSRQHVLYFISLLNISIYKIFNETLSHGTFYP